MDDQGFFERWTLLDWGRLILFVVVCVVLMRLIEWWDDLMR